MSTYVYWSAILAMASSAGILTFWRFWLRPRWLILRALQGAFKAMHDDRRSDD